MSWMEWFAFISGVGCVYLIVIERDVNWPIGVINSIALLYVFWTQKLFAQAWLQVFYVFECLYGWWMWTRRDRATGSKLIHIGRTRSQTLARLALLFVIGVSLLTPLFRLTRDPMPFWDSMVTVVSLVAEYMLCIKLYEAWPAYAAADLISLVILAALGAWVTFATYLLFFALCVMGMVEWWKRLKRNLARVSSLASSIPLPADTSI